MHEVADNIRIQQETSPSLTVSQFELSALQAELKEEYTKLAPKYARGWAIRFVVMMSVLLLIQGTNPFGVIMLALASGFFAYFGAYTCFLFLAPRTAREEARRRLQQR